MAQCKSCFLAIADARKEVTCTTCQGHIHKDCAIKEDGAFYCDLCYTVKEEGGNMQEVQVPEVIRRSYIETYRSCPYKFFMQVIKGMEAPPTAYTQVGIDLHELFDKASNDRTFDKEDMREKFQIIWDKYPFELFESNYEFQTKMWNRAVDSIDAFYNLLPSFPYTPFATEQKILFDVGEDLPKVSITMDRIDEDGDDLIISDYKTGVVMVGQKLSTDLQAPLYIKAVRDHFGRSVARFDFYYLQENKVRTFHRIDDENYVCRVNKREYFINITDAVREVQSLFSRIKKGDFNIPRDTRKMHFTCKMCHLKANGTCKGADEESWYQYNRGVS